MQVSTQSVARPEFVSTCIICCDQNRIILMLSFLELITVFFFFFQVIETLSKLSRTPIAIATGIRYVVGLVSGGNNASCMVFLQVAVGGHLGDISTSFA